jgi:spoIIIJ-associated protein
VDEVRVFQEELLKRAGMELSVEVEMTPENLFVRLTGADRDFMLQDRAELLEANQYLLTRIFGHQLPERCRIVVDCDGFRRQKEEELREIAQRLAERVKKTGRSEQLGLMNAYDRRIVHLALAEDGEVTTQSEGEGPMKRVTIAPAKRA